MAVSTFQSMSGVGMHNIEARRGGGNEHDTKLTQFMSVADVHDVDLANELVVPVSSLHLILYLRSPSCADANLWMGCGCGAQFFFL